MTPEHRTAEIGDQPPRGTDEAAPDFPRKSTDAAASTWVPSARASPEVIVVLGMHRSGTSLCMSMLQGLGVRLDDDLIPGDANNEPGYFESSELVQLNEGILRTLGAAWDTVFSLAIPDGWADAPAILPAKKALRDLITRKAINGPDTWGFKDPRTTVLLPLYEQVFAECGIRAKYILCLRDPRAVAQSLKKRNHFPPLLSELLWLDYTMPAIQVLGQRLEAIVVYERWFQNAIGQAESLVRVVGPGAAGSLESIVQRAVAPTLNHADAQAGEFELACSRSVYESLLAGDLERATAVFTETWQAIGVVMGPAAGRGVLGAQGGIRQEEQPMQRSGRIMTQAFWRSEGGEFEEVASAREFSQENSERRSVRLVIPGGLGPQPQFRLDPVDLPGIAQLFGIKLMDPGGAVIWEWDGQATTLAALDRRHVVVLERIDEAGVFLYLPTSDPRLLLPVCAELDQLSETGGSLELDFAWCGTIQSTF